MIFRSLLALIFALYVSMANAISETDITDENGQVDPAKIQQLISDAEDSDATVLKIYNLLQTVKGQTSEEALTTIYGALTDTNNPDAANAANAFNTLNNAIPGEAAAITQAALVATASNQTAFDAVQRAADALDDVKVIRTQTEAGLALTVSDTNTNLSFTLPPTGNSPSGGST